MPPFSIGPAEGGKSRRSAKKVKPATKSGKAKAAKKTAKAKTPKAAKKTMKKPAVRTARLDLRCTPAERKKIVEVAKRKGVTHTAVVMEAIAKVK